MAAAESIANIILANAGNIAKTMAKSWLFDARQQSLAVEVDHVKKMVVELEGEREKYRTSGQDSCAQIEQRRTMLLTRLTQCQTRILFEIRDADVIATIGPFSIEQMTATYKATSDADLGEVEFGIQKMDAILNRNTELKGQRRNHRSLAIGFTIVVIGLLGIVMWIASRDGWSPETAIPILNIPVPVIIWSLIGSLGAMLYRFNTLADAEMDDPLRWSFTRPLTGVLMGIVAYMVFNAGVLLLQPPATTGSIVSGSGSRDQLLWLASFLAGFSDRFADSVLRALAGRLGGDKQSDLMTTDSRPATSRLSVGALVDLLRLRRRDPPPAAQADTDQPQPAPIVTRAAQAPIASDVAQAPVEAAKTVAQPSRRSRRTDATAPQHPGLRAVPTTPATPTHEPSEPQAADQPQEAI